MQKSKRVYNRKKYIHKKKTLLYSSFRLNSYRLHNLINLKSMVIIRQVQNDILFLKKYLFVA